MQNQMRTPGRNTPGRRRNANKENVYFEPGKYGRKTGITLKDTGRRDEHGFEPVSGIFSSPQFNSPERQPLGRRTRNSTIAEVLEPRRTPRLPPPRSQTPKKTNIGGSPIRHSAIKIESPLRTRYDDITPTRARSAHDDEEDEIGTVVHSIERGSDTAGEAMLSRAKKPRKSIFEFNLSPEKAAHSSPAAATIQEVSRILDVGDDLVPPADEIADYDLPVAQDDSIPALGNDSVVDVSVVQQSLHAHGDEPNTKRKRGARRSDISQRSVEEQPEPVSSSKRRRTTGGNSLLIDPVLLQGSPAGRPSTSSRRSGAFEPPSIVEQPDFDNYGGDEVVHFDDQEPDMQNEDEAGSPLPVGEEEEEAATAGRRGNQRRRKSVVRKPRQQTKSKTPAASSRQRVRVEQQPVFSHRDDDESDNSDADAIIRGRFRLRSTTPFAESDVKVTRSGRASIKPLAYWKNETFVYRHGDIEGVIRAEELPDPKRKQRKRKTRRGGGLASIEEEEEEAEDLLAEAWEEEVGIIKGLVRAWDAEVQNGSIAEEDEQDVAFAARAIDTQEVAGGAFRYAKVLTSPFFGAGIVELPPGGVKRTKNCRKMQMVFFVHRGKVTVDVAGMQFGVTQGGIWQVPRGNNYSIENESSTYPATIFFAQGCEYDSATAVDESQTN